MVMASTAVVVVQAADKLTVKQWAREVALTDELPECVKELALKLHADLCR
jgi:hypothetical protein